MPQTHSVRNVLHAERPCSSPTALHLSGEGAYLELVVAEGPATLWIWVHEMIKTYAGEIDFVTNYLLLDVYGFPFMHR